MHSFCRQESLADKVPGTATLGGNKKFARSRSTPRSLDGKDQSNALQESRARIQQPARFIPSSSLLTFPPGCGGSGVGIPPVARLCRLRSYGCFDRSTSNNHTEAAQMNIGGLNPGYTPCTTNSAGGTIFANSHSGSSGFSKNSSLTNDYKSSNPACNSSKGDYGSGHAWSFLKKSVSLHCTADLEPYSGVCSSHRAWGNAESPSQRHAVQQHSDWKQANQQVRAAQSHGSSTVKEVRGRCGVALRRRKHVLSPSATGTPQAASTSEYSPAFSQRTPQYLHNQLYGYVSRRKQYQKVSQQQQVQQHHQQQLLQEPLSLDRREAAVSPERAAAYNLPFDPVPTQPELLQEHPLVGQSQSVKHCPRPRYEIQRSTTRRLRPVALHDSQHQQYYRKQHPQQHYRLQHQQKQDSEPKTHHTTDCLSPAYCPLQPSASSPTAMYHQQQQQMQGGSSSLCDRDMNACLDPLLQQFLLQAHDQLCVSSQQVYSRSVGSPSLLQQTLAGTPVKLVPDTCENYSNHLCFAGQNLSPFSSFSAPQSSISFSASSLRSAGESSFCSNDVGKDEQQGTSISSRVSSHTPTPLASSFDFPLCGGAASSLHYFVVPAPRVAGHSAAVPAENEKHCIPSPHMSTYKHAVPDNSKKQRQNDVFSIPEAPFLLPTIPSGTGAVPAIHGDNVGGGASICKTSAAETVATVTDCAAISDCRPRTDALTYTDHVARSLAGGDTTACGSVGTAAAGISSSENNPEGKSKPAVSAASLAGPSCASSVVLRGENGGAAPVSHSSKPVRVSEDAAKCGRPHKEGTPKDCSGIVSSVNGDTRQWSGQDDTVHRPPLFFFPPKDRSFLRPLGTPLAADTRVPTSGGMDNKEKDYVARKYEFILPDYLLALRAPLIAPSEVVVTNQTSAAALLRTRCAVNTSDPTASASTTAAVSASSDCGGSAVDSAAARVLLDSAAQLNLSDNLRFAAVTQKSTGASDGLSTTMRECEGYRRKKGTHAPKRGPQQTESRKSRPRGEQIGRQSSMDLEDTGGTFALARPPLEVARKYTSEDAARQPKEQKITFSPGNPHEGKEKTGMTAHVLKGNIAAQWRMDRGSHSRAGAHAQRYSLREMEQVEGDDQEGGQGAGKKGETERKDAAGVALDEELHTKQRGTGSCAGKGEAFLLARVKQQWRRKAFAAAAVLESQRRAKSLPARKFSCPMDKGSAAAAADVGRNAPECRVGVAHDGVTAGVSASERCAKGDLEDRFGNVAGRGQYAEEQAHFAFALVRADQQRHDTEQIVIQATEKQRNCIAAEGSVQLDLQGVQRVAEGTQRTNHSSSSGMQRALDDKDDSAEGSEAAVGDAQAEQESLPQQRCQRRGQTATLEQEMDRREEFGGPAAGCSSCSLPINIPTTDGKSHGDSVTCRPRGNRTNTHYYQVLRLLGRGTFGQVYECLQFDAYNGEAVAVVAVKVVKNDEAYTRSALQEIAILQQLNSKSHNNSSCASEAVHAVRANGRGNASVSGHGHAADRKGGIASLHSGGRDDLVQSGEEPPWQQSQDSKWKEKSRDRDGQQQMSGHERQLDADLGQKRVVQLLDNFTYRGHQCLVFEILQTDLYQLMKKYRFSGFPLPAVKQVCRELLQGLAHLRRMRIVHCDLKPENILVRFSGPVPVKQQSSHDQTHQHPLQQHHCSLQQAVPLTQHQQLLPPHQPQHPKLHKWRQNRRYSAPQFTSATGENGQKQRSGGVSDPRAVAPFWSVLPIGRSTTVSAPGAAPNTLASAEEQRIRKKDAGTEMSWRTRDSVADEASPRGCTEPVDIVPAPAGAATCISTATTPASAAATAAFIPLTARSTRSALSESQLHARSRSHLSRDWEYLTLEHTCRQTAACNVKAWPSHIGTEVTTYDKSSTCITRIGQSPPLSQNLSLTSSPIAVSWKPPPASSPSAESSTHFSTRSVQSLRNAPSLPCKEARAGAWTKQVACASACRTAHPLLPATGKTQTKALSVPTAVAASKISPVSATAQNAYWSISVKVIDFSSAYYLPSYPQPADAAAVEALEQRQARHPAAPYLYAQSRFYGAPEVMLGVHYMEKLDIWALGCVAAELYTGKPLLPGTSDFDQMRRLVALRGNPPDWMLRLGRRTSTYFIRDVQVPQHRKRPDEVEQEKGRLWQKKGEKKDRQEEQQPTRQQWQAQESHMEPQGKHLQQDGERQQETQETRMEQKQKQQKDSVPMRQKGQDGKRLAGEKMMKKFGKGQEGKKHQQLPTCEKEGCNQTPVVEKTRYITHACSLNITTQVKSERAGDSPSILTERWGAFSATPPGVSKRNRHAWWQRALVAVSPCSILERKSMQDRDGRRFGTAQQQQAAGSLQQQQERSVYTAQHLQHKENDQRTPVATAPGTHQQQLEMDCRCNVAEVSSQQQIQHAETSPHQEEHATVPPVEPRQQGVWGTEAAIRHQKCVPSISQHRRGCLKENSEGCTWEEISGKRCSDSSGQIPFLTTPDSRLPRGEASENDEEETKGRENLNCGVSEAGRCLHKTGTKAKPRSEDAPDDACVDTETHKAEDILSAASAEGENAQARNGVREELAEGRRCTGLRLCGPEEEEIEWRLKTAEEAGEGNSSREGTSTGSPILRSLQDLLTMRKQREQLWRLHTKHQEATPQYTMRSLQVHCFGCCWPMTSEADFGEKFATQMYRSQVLEAKTRTSQFQINGDAKICFVPEAGMDVRPPVMSEKAIHPAANQSINTSPNTPPPPPRTSALATSALEKQSVVEATRLLPSSTAEEANLESLDGSEAHRQYGGVVPASVHPQAGKSSYTPTIGDVSVEFHHKGIRSFLKSRDSIGEDRVATEAVVKPSNQNKTRKGSRTGTREFALNEPQRRQQPLSTGTSKQERTGQSHGRTAGEETAFPSQAGVDTCSRPFQPAVSSATSLFPSEYPSTTSVSPSPAAFSSSRSPGGAGSEGGVAEPAASCTTSSSPRHTEPSHNEGAGAGSTFVVVAATTPAEVPTAAAAPKTLAQSATNVRQSLPERATRFLKKLMKGRTPRPSCATSQVALFPDCCLRTSSSQRACTYDDDSSSLPTEKSSATPGSPFTTPISIGTQTHGGVASTTCGTPSNSPSPFTATITSAVLLASSCAVRQSSRRFSVSPGAAAAECPHSPQTASPPPGARLPTEPNDTSSHGYCACSSTDACSPSFVLPAAAASQRPSAPSAADTLSPPQVSFGSCPWASSSNPPVSPVAAPLSSEAVFPTVHGTAVAVTASSRDTGSSGALPSLENTAASLPRSHCSCSAVFPVASSSSPPFPPQGTPMQKYTSSASTAGSTSACLYCSLQHTETAVGETAAVAEPTTAVLQMQRETATATRTVACSTLPDDPARALLEELAEQERQEMLFLDFLDGLLQVDPFKRFTAEEALRHPFVAEDFITSREAAELPVAIRAALPGTATTKPAPRTVLTHPAESEAKGALEGMAVVQTPAEKENAAAAAAATAGVAQPQVCVYEQEDIIPSHEEGVRPTVSEPDRANHSSLVAEGSPAHQIAATASEATTNKCAELSLLHEKPHGKESCISVEVVAARFGSEVYPQHLRETAIDKQYHLWRSRRFKEIRQRLGDDPAALQTATAASQEQGEQSGDDQQAAEIHNVALQQDRCTHQTGADNERAAGVSEGVAAVNVDGQKKVGLRLEQDTSRAAEFPRQKSVFDATPARSSRRLVQEHFHEFTAQITQQECTGAPPATADKCTLVSCGAASGNHSSGLILPSSERLSSTDFRPIEASAEDVRGVATATADDNSGRSQSSSSAWADDVRRLQDALLLHHVQNVLEEDALKARHKREQQDLQRRQAKELQELRQQALLTRQLLFTKRNVACGFCKPSTDA